MTRNIIRDGWDAYRTNLIPEDESIISKNRCRHAYYAGAMIAFNAFMVLCDPEEETPRVDDVIQLMGIGDEIAEYLDEEEMFDQIQDEMYGDGGPGW